jgi:hypothetical protein
MLHEHVGKPVSNVPTRIKCLKEAIFVNDNNLGDRTPESIMIPVVLPKLYTERTA